MHADGVEVTYRNGSQLWIPAQPFEIRETALDMQCEPKVIRVAVYLDGTVKTWKKGGTDETR